MSTGATSLAAWSARPRARALCAWRNGDLAPLAKRVEQVLGAWARDWAVRVGDAGAVVCAEAESRKSCAGLPWRRLGSAAHGAAWIAWSGQQAAQLARTWFDAESAGTPVVSTVVEACLRDAEVRLAAALQLEGTQGTCEPPAAAWDRWSGAVVVEMGCGGLLLVESGVLRRLPGAIAPAIANPRQRLVAITQAISQTELSLQVRLDGCELELGELQALQVGDVLCLRHGTQAPAMVAPAGGPVLFHAWLARSRGRRAVELAPLSPS